MKSTKAIKELINITEQVRVLRNKGFTIRQIANSVDKTTQSVHKIIMKGDTHFESESVVRKRKIEYRNNKIDQILK